MPNDREDLEFQISFFEGVLRRQPESVQALSALGEAYTCVGKFRQGLAVDQQLARLRPNDPVVHYNLACDYSLLKQTAPSIRALERALRLGYDDFDLLENDPHLNYVRRSVRYKELLAKAFAQRQKSNEL
ncbi:MAG: hypothetical protein JW937_00855 [Candidatus Omnitrophica bacterium]|nr:hypothetical protein [Candidatus Omnitrophota bacterium]